MPESIGKGIILSYPFNTNYCPTMECSRHQISAEKAYIQALLATILPSPDVICLQETHLRQNDVFSLLDYQPPIYGQTTGSHHNGLLTMVKKGIIATPRETPDMGNIEVQAIQIHLPLGKIDIVNIYGHQSMTLGHDKTIPLLNKDHVVVLGDFNSHHPLWGSP